MHVPIPSRALLRSLAAGALVLAGATACSRPDRGDSDNSASIAQDTMSTAPDQTGSNAGRDSATVAPLDAPRSATASPSTRRGDTSMTADSAAGYRAMARDTATVPNESDSARVTHDSSETTEAPSDTAAVESSSAPAGAAALGVTATMARDTSTTADQTDTVAIRDTAGAEASDSGRAGAVLAAGAAGAAIAAAADRDDNDAANAERVGETSTVAEESETVALSDSAGIADPTDTVAVSDTAATLQASVDTSHYAEPSDSGRAGAVVAAGAAGAAVAAAAGRDSDAANGDPVRPAEEANETRGQVTTDDHRAVASADTLETEGIRPPEDSTEILGNVTSYETADEEPVNRADEVGAAAVSGTLTGAEAVGLTTRQGAQCTVVDPENDEAVRWDMASTPVTLNPCGLGSMNLSKVWTRVE